MDERRRRRRLGAPALALATLFLWLGAGGREAASGNAPDGSPCASPSSCTSGFCVDGVCCDSACNAPSACSVCAAAKGASADGTCSLLSGTPCDDHDPCTTKDTCQSGACVGTAPVFCPAPDACHEAYCDPRVDGGACVAVPGPDGTPCDDHDVCTRTDTCQGGACVGKDPVTCPLQADCATPGTCDSVRGCSTSSAPSCGPADAGAPLDAGSALGNGAGCGAGAQCASGFCVAGVCCDSACTSPCHSCALPGSPGVCTEEPEGVDLGHECGAEGTCLLTCGPGGACISSGPGTQCEPPRCIDDHRGLGPAECSSYGAPCPTEASVPFDCSPYLCVAALGGCAPKQCRTVHDCAPGYVCGEDNHCGPSPDVAAGSDCHVVPGSLDPRGGVLFLTLGAAAALGRRRRARGGSR